MAQVQDFADVRPSPAVRSTLASAGHAMGEWSDRHLVAIQLTVQQLLQGRRVFVSHKIRPLVDTLLRASHAQKPR